MFSTHSCDSCALQECVILCKLIFKLRADGINLQSFGTGREIVEIFMIGSDFEKVYSLLSEKGTKQYSTCKIISIRKQLFETSRSLSQVYARKAMLKSPDFVGKV